MTFIFIDKGETIRLGIPAPSGAIDHLPAKVYTIEHDEDGVFLKVKTERFTIPEKIYGKNHAKHVKLVCGEWDPKGSVGAMFVGAKGTGKSLTAESIANKMLDKGVPTIYIDTQIPPQVVKHVIRNIGPCTVIFEEFGKMYPIRDMDPNNLSRDGSASDQDQLLSLFSDTDLKGVLFLITENATHFINIHLHARPDRVKYFFRYSAPKFSVFKDVAEGYPIHAEIMSYIEFLFSDYCSTFSTGDYGLDVLKVFRDQAVNVTDIDDYIESLLCMNVPPPSRMAHRIDSVFNLETGAVFERFTVTPTSTGKVKLKVLDEKFDVLGEFSIALEDLVFASSDDPDDTLGFKTGIFKANYGTWAIIGDAYPVLAGISSEPESFRFIMPRADTLTMYARKTSDKGAIEKEILGEEAYGALVEERLAMQQRLTPQPPTPQPGFLQSVSANTEAMRAGLNRARGNFPGVNVIPS